MSPLGHRLVPHTKMDAENAALKAQVAELTKKIAALSAGSPAGDAADAPPAPAAAAAAAAAAPVRAAEKGSDMSPEEVALRGKIEALAAQIQASQARKAPTSEWLPFAKQQKALKEEFAQTLGKKYVGKTEAGGRGAGAKAKKKKREKYVAKTPLGMVDHNPEEMALREAVIARIKEIFKRHGAVQIETPVAELKQTLTGKYGEDSKLIYDLADQGGEILALRYDLTVPFARYCAEHGVKQIKRYHIARVYRRDRPVVTKGRFREFYQCDIDIRTEPGTYVPMLPDAECIKIACEILGELELGDFLIKVNNRKVLDGMFEVCGVPADKFRTICSAVDKLDKLEWAEVKCEMVDEKGLDPAAADRIGEYVKHASIGGEETLQYLQADADMMANKRAREGIDEMAKLIAFCKLFRCAHQISFDLSLARGLDYYTGVIYEAIMVGQDVGSVAGGGRYDYLVSMFSKKKNKAAPCVGVSIGIERLFAIVKRQREAAAKAGSKAGAFGAIRENPCDVLVCSAGKNLVEPRMAACAELWEAGIRAEMIQKANPKFLTQVQYAERNRIPHIVIIGEGELAQGIVKVRDTVTKGEVEVPRASLSQYFAGLKRERSVGATAAGEGVAPGGANSNVPMLCGGGESKAASGLKIESAGSDGRFAFARP